jgi:hypothetical protein
MKTPSFLRSTLSLMTLMSLCVVLYCAITGIKIEGELLAVITSVIGAYTGSRLPND